MFEKCIVKDKLDNLEKKLDTLVNKDEFESFKKEFEDFKENYLISTNQKYLYEKIKEYIFKNYDKIKLKYTKDEDRYLSEEWIYKDDNISIIKYVYKYPSMFYCNSLTIDFTPRTYFNKGDEYNIEFKGNILEDKCKSKEIFEKIQELKKGA